MAQFYPLFDDETFFVPVDETGAVERSRSAIAPVRRPTLLERLVDVVLPTREEPRGALAGRRLRSRLH